MFRGRLLALLLALLVLVFLMLVCACGPPLQPTYKRSSLDCFRHPEWVPIIAVAKIEPKAVTFVGGPYNFKPLVGPVLLYKVNPTIENVVQGSVTLGNADVFVYASTTVFPGAIGFSGSRAFRDMVLLRREHGKLRVIEDIDSNCKTGVYSGAHPGFKPRPGDPVRQQMIDLLLTPGLGATDLGMMRAIFDWTRPKSRRHTPPKPC